MARVLRCSQRDEPTDLETRRQMRTYVRSLIWEAYKHHCDALHAFYHEADDVVRFCYARCTADSDGWVEAGPPLGGPEGLRILTWLRRHGRMWPGAAALATKIVCLAGNVRHSVELVSPHVWDVRLYFTSSRPRKPPFALILASYWEQIEPHIPKPPSTAAVGPAAEHPAS